jgi:hypothetical protein
MAAVNADRGLLWLHARRRLQRSERIDRAHRKRPVAIAQQARRATFAAHPVNLDARI